MLEGQTVVTCYYLSCFLSIMHRHFVLVAAAFAASLVVGVLFASPDILSKPAPAKLRLADKHTQQSHAAFPEVTNPERLCTVDMLIPGRRCKHRCKHVSRTVWAGATSGSRMYSLIVQAAPVCVPASSHDAYPFQRAFVVSLQHERLDSFISRLPPRLETCMTHVAATDGRSINLTEWQEHGLYNSSVNEQLANDTAFAQVFPKPHPSLTRGELGCHDSHRRIWWAMVQQNIPAALICEDAAWITGKEELQMLQVAHELKISSTSFHILYLGTNWTPHLKPVHGTNLSEPNIYGLFHVTHAYVLTLEGARILLSRSLPALYPVDVYIASQLRYGLRALQTNKSIVGTDRMARSDTQRIH